MLGKSEKRPSLEEARRETARRLKIVDVLEDKLAHHADALLLVGSLAWGNDYCVRESSDIDIVLLVEPKNVARVVRCGFFAEDDWTRDALRLYQDGAAAVFSLKTECEGVNVECHVWNKEKNYAAVRMGITQSARFSRNPVSKSGMHFDFAGNQQGQERRTTPFKSGFLMEYPVFRVIDGHFVPYEPINNVISAPDIRFARDQRLYDNIDVLWTRLAQRLAEENAGGVDLSEKSILFSQGGYWNFPPYVQAMIQDRTARELKKIGAKYTNHRPQP